MNGINSNQDQFLASLNLLQSRQSRLQEQISSGLRVSKPSDDPNLLGDILSLTAEIGRTGQVKSNLASVKAEADAAESGLETAVQLLQNGVSLAAQGASSIVTQSQRKILAGQVQGLLEQLVSISRTQVAGQFIFRGDHATQPSYQVNLQSPNGVDRLIQTSSTRLIQDATGITFSAAETAQTIFDHRNPDDSVAGDNVFAALNQLRTALLNNDQPGIASASDAVKSAQDWLNGQLGFYGNLQNRIQQASTVADQFQLQEQTSLSGLRDTNAAAAALEVTEVQTNITAALTAQARQPLTSLFDFLK